MADYVGIYGFAMTQQIQAAGIAIKPCFSDHKDVLLRADGPDRFFLTAVAELPHQNARALAFDLAAALTFCQSRWVIVSRPSPAQAGLTLDQFKSNLPQIPSTLRRVGNLLVNELWKTLLNPHLDSSFSTFVCENCKTRFSTNKPDFVPDFFDALKYYE